MANQQLKAHSRKDKISLLQGIFKGKRSIKELLPKETYIVFSEDGAHWVRHCITQELQVMNDQQFKEWYYTYRASWVPGSQHNYLTHIIEGDPDPRDEPILE